MKLKPVYNALTGKFDFVNQDAVSKDLGQYTTLTALQTAYPSPDSGSYARVVATNTYYVYEGGAWVNSGLTYEAANVDFREYNNQSTDPSAPEAGKARIYVKNNRLLLRNDTQIIPVNTIEPSIIRRDRTGASTEWEPVNSQAMAELVLNSFSSATVNDDATVNYYLHSDTPEKKFDGSDSALDGGDGQVMIVSRAPIYLKEWQDGNYDYKAISLLPADGFEEFPRFGIGKYKGYIDANGKLCSISGVTPTTNITPIEGEAAAQLRGSNWHIEPYGFTRLIVNLLLFKILSNDAQTELGYVSRANSTDWLNYNNYNPVVKTGYMNDQKSLFTGNKPLTLTNFVGGTSDLVTEIVSFLGIENFFGETWEWKIGLNILYDTTHMAVLYKKLPPYEFDTTANHTEIAYIPSPASAYVKELIPGHIIPQLTGGGSATYFCDYHYKGSAGWRVPRSGGSFSSGSNSGPFFFGFNVSSGYRNASIGVRSFCLIAGTN
jgi:hypothetical protein